MKRVPGNLLTTAMGVMPHRNVEKALKLALSMDIPFWPQLPLYSYYEDMYVQASEHFPGIILDMERKTLHFSTKKFMDELDHALSIMDDPDRMDVSKDYSIVYHRFLSLNLKEKPAIRGQLEGPVSFGLNVTDENKRPILFNDVVRPFLFEFMAKRVNAQLKRLKNIHKNAFMFVDEPGLQFLFSGLSGYTDTLAREDMELFFSMVERPRGVHLCGNPDWDFLLSLDLDVLSLDIYTNGEIFSRYAKRIKRFLEEGRVIIWGIVPTNVEPFSKESLESLESRLETLWEELERKGIPKELVVLNGLLSPATCCLVNPDGEKTVEKAFNAVKALSKKLRERYMEILDA